MRVFLILLTLFFLGACTPRLVPPPPPTQIPTTLELPSPTPISPTREDTQVAPPLSATIPPNTDTQTIVEKSKEDLAQRLGISVEKIIVSAVIGQDFSTDAFYCRVTKEPITKNESPTLTSGWIILLDVSKHRYEYHASDETVIFCRSLP